MKTCTRKTRIEFFGENSSNQFAPHSKDKIIYRHYCCIVLKQMYVPQDLGLAYIFCWGNVNARKTYIVCPPSKLTVKDIESTPVLDKCSLK